MFHEWYKNLTISFSLIPVHHVQVFNYHERKLGVGQVYKVVIVEYWFTIN